MDRNEPTFRNALGRVKAKVQGGGSLEVSQVQVVGLDSIREAAGDAWPRIAARVRTGSLCFLEQRLGEDDVLVPVREGFIIVYGKSVGDREAAERAVALQEALDLFFIGEEGMASLRAKVERRVIPAAALAAMVDGGAGASDEARPPWAPPPASPPTIVFLPVWNVHQQAITAYWPIPAHQQAEGPVRYSYDLNWDETGRHGSADFQAQDLEILDRAIAGLERAVQTGRRCLVGYSVHASTMRNRGLRQAFLRRLSDAPEAVRPYLLGRIAAIEPDTPAATIAEWAHHLRPWGLRVALELHHSERLLGGLDGVGAFSVSCALPAKQSAEKDRLHCGDLIRRWTAAFKRQDLKFRLDNVRDPRLMALAVRSGVDFCSTEHFWPATALPNGMRPYTREQLDREIEARERTADNSAIGLPLEVSFG